MNISELLNKPIEITKYFNKFKVFITPTLRICYRILKILLLILRLFLIVLFIFILISEIIPRILIHENVDDYTGEEPQFAQYTLNTTRNFIGGSAEPLFVTGMEITRIITLPFSSGKITCETYGIYPPQIFTENYLAEVRLFTFFGLPYRQVTVFCENPMDPGLLIEGTSPSFP